MRKGSVVTPLTLGFSIMVLLTSALLLVSLYFYARQLYMNFAEIIVNLQRMTTTARFQSSLLEGRWAAERYLVDWDPAYRTQAEEACERSVSRSSPGNDGRARMGRALRSTSGL
jgi:hypothetical protein